MAALPAALSEQYLRTALGMIQQSGKERGEFSLTKQLQRAVDPDGQWTYQQLQAVARRAISGTQKAQALNADPDRVPLRADHTIDPGLDGEPTTYRYRVLVSITNAAGAVVRFSADIDAGSGRSVNQLADIVRGNLEGVTSDTRGTREAISRLGANTTVGIELTFAGRH